MSKAANPQSVVKSWIQSNTPGLRDGDQKSKTIILMRLRLLSVAKRKGLKCFVRWPRIPIISAETKYKGHRVNETIRANKILIVYTVIFCSLNSY